MGDRVFSAPALPLAAIKDPTGAGDAFAGGFLGAISRAGTVDEAVLRRAMLYGSVLGSLAVQDFSVTGVAGAGMDEVESRFDRLVDMISLAPPGQRH